MAESIQIDMLVFADHGLDWILAYPLGGRCMCPFFLNDKASDIGNLKAHGLILGLSGTKMDV